MISCSKSCFSDRKVTAFSLLGLVGFVISLMLFNSDPIMSADSDGYIGFGIQRPLGYPWFLRGLQTLFRSFALLPYIQLAVYWTALTYLTLGCFKITEKPLYIAMFFVGFALNYPFIKMAFFILPESFSAAFLMLILGTLLRFFDTQKLKYLLWVSFCIGLGILCKPVFKFMLVVPILLWALFFRKTFSLINLGKIYMPVLVLFLLGSTGQYIKNDVFNTEDFLGHNLLGKAGIIAKEDTPSTLPQFMEPFIKESLKVQSVLQKASQISLAVEFSLACRFYDEMRYAVLGKITQENHLKLTDHDHKTIALEIIKNNPLGYAKDVLMSYIGAWTFLELRTTAQNRNIYEFLDSHKNQIEPSVLDYFQGFRHFKRYYGNTMAYFMRLAFGLAFLSSLYFIGLGFYRGFKQLSLSTAELTGFTSACMIHAGFLVICLVQAAFPRYTLLFWPCIVFLLVLGFRELVLKIYPHYEKA
ncbi:MAG: hypothetical protein WCG05_02405 [Alphaproteobacteria bacterium]